jgi:hypothetical protein
MPIAWTTWRRLWMSRDNCKRPSTASPALPQSRPHSRWIVTSLSTAIRRVSTGSSTRFAGCASRVGILVHLWRPPFPPHIHISAQLSTDLSTILARLAPPPSHVARITERRQGHVQSLLEIGHSGRLLALDGHVVHMGVSCRVVGVNRLVGAGACRHCQ